MKIKGTYLSEQVIVLGRAILLRGVTGERMGENVCFNADCFHEASSLYHGTVQYKIAVVLVIDSTHFRKEKSIAVFRNRIKEAGSRGQA